MTRTNSLILGTTMMALAVISAFSYTIYGVGNARTRLEANELAIAYLDSVKAEKSTVNDISSKVNENTDAMNAANRALNGLRSEMFGQTIRDTSGTLVYTPGLRDLVRGRKDSVISGSDTLSINVSGLVNLTARVEANTGARRAMATWKAQAAADIERIGAYAMAGDDLTAGREAFGEYHKAAKGANRAASDSAFTANASAGMAQAIGEGIAAPGLGNVNSKLSSLSGRVISTETAIGNLILDRDKLLLDRDATRAALNAHAGAKYKLAHGTTPRY